MGLRPGQKHSGSFKAGEGSANPGGRPRAAKGWRESIRNDKKLRALARRAAKGTLKPGEKPDKAMLQYLLDQGFGRAQQTVEQKGAVSIGVVILPAEDIDK
jgi:hypothetical protein